MSDVDTQKSRSFLILGSSLARTLSQFGFLLIVTVLFGAKAAGTYALALAIAAPVFVVAGLGLRSIYFSFQPAPQVRAVEKALRRSYVTGLLVTLIVGLLTAQEIIPLLMLVSFLKITDGHADLYALRFQRSARYGLVFQQAILRACVGLLLGCGAAITFDSLILALGGVVLGNSAIAILVTRRIAISEERDEKSAEMSKNYWYLLRAGALVGLSDGIVSLGVSAPQYLLAYFGGPEAVVSYVYISYIFVAAEMLLNARILIWLNRRDLSIRAFVRESTISALLLVPLVALGAVVVEVISDALAFEALGSSGLYWFSLSLFALVMPLVYVSNGRMMLKRLFGWAIPVSIGVAIGIVAGGVLLIPVAGVAGAVFAFVLGALLRLGLIQVAFLGAKAPSTGISV